MQDLLGPNEQKITWLEHAQPAELKEFVERDVFAGRRQLELALANRPNLATLWEAYVWSFVIASDPTGVIESARRALARQASPNLLLWLGAAHLHRGENAQALSVLQRSAQLNLTALTADALGR